MAAVVSVYKQKTTTNIIEIVQKVSLSPQNEQENLSKSDEKVHMGSGPKRMALLANVWLTLRYIRT